jgi:hypothetical protein
MSQQVIGFYDFAMRRELGAMAESKGVGWNDANSVAYTCAARELRDDTEWEKRDLVLCPRTLGP